MIPDGVSTVSSPARAGRSDHGLALAAISRRTVGLIKEYYGKGPTKARTYHTGDLVVVLLSGGYTVVENTLLQEGRSRTVMEQRAEFQEVMGRRFKQVVEEELRREVIAFMSTSHYEPDFNAELFVLKAQGTTEPDAVSEHIAQEDGHAAPGSLGSATNS